MPTIKEGQKNHLQLLRPHPGSAYKYEAKENLRLTVQEVARIPMGTWNNLKGTLREFYSGVSFLAPDKQLWQVTYGTDICVYDISNDNPTPNEKLSIFTISQSKSESGMRDEWAQTGKNSWECMRLVFKVDGSTIHIYELTGKTDDSYRETTYHSEAIDWLCQIPTNITDKLSRLQALGVALSRHLVG